MERMVYFNQTVHSEMPLYIYGYPRGEAVRAAAT